MENNILDGLNPEQQKAVLHTEGPVMVVAGAGSGKTRVLTYRIAYLLEKNVDPFNILALTFTNKAAREMKNRIAQLVGWSKAQSLWMGTFHSIFARILRFEASLLGFPSNFTIYDTDDSKSLMRSIVKENNLDPKIYQVGFVLNRISSAKNSLISVDAYAENTELVNQDKSSGRPFIAQLYRLYQKRLFQSASMDFDDLLFKINVLFRDFPEVLHKYQQKFQYILVDEYQDTNYSQYLIVKKLAANNENVCVVGDDAQSIYAFRGANIENILNFRKDYSDIFTVKLEQNYRSTKNIVNAANSVIYNNKKQIFKKVWTQNQSGDKIKLIRTNSDKEEGSMVAHQIFQDQMNHQLQLDSFAVLYRTNAQSRSIEESLRRLNLPYRIYGGLSFYKRKEVKDLLAYFRITINTSDEESLKRIINYPARGIGKTTLQKIVIASTKLGLPMWEVMKQARKLNVGLSHATINKIDDFVTLIESFRAQLGKQNAHDLAQHIARSTHILKTLYEDKTPEGVNRFENIEEMMNGIKEFVENDQKAIELPGENEKSLDAYMQDIALLTDADENEKDDRPKVSLMTIHQAKGLEFPYVFIVGLEENLFPSMMSLHSRADLEEERRLFYVAITRAKNSLFLSYAQSRWKFGKLDFCEPSRFIDEIDEQYIDIPRKSPSISNTFRGGIRIKAQTIRNKTARSSGSVYKSISTSDKNKSADSLDENTNVSNPDDIIEGIKVKHKRFGEGIVSKVDGQGPNKKASVVFIDGEKQLILRFARLQIVI